MRKSTLLPRGNFSAAAFCLALTVLFAVSAGAAVQRVERGNLVLEDIPEIPAELAEKLERYVNGRQATFLDWTPEGGMLIATRFGNVEQIHWVDQPLGMRRQLTFYNEPVTKAYYSPRGVQKGFVFLKDVGGNEYAQIYFYARETGETRLLTDGRSLNGSPVWSNDGRQLAFFSTKRNGVSYDVYVIDLSASAEPRPEPRLIAALDGGAWYPLDWSADNRFLLVKNFISINQSHLFVLDVATGTKRRILPAKPDERLGIGEARFARDRHGIYVTHDQDGEFRQLRFVRLPEATTELDKPGKLETQLLSGHIPWDVETFDVSLDDRYLAFVTNEDGVSRLNLLDTRDQTRLPPIALPPGRVSAVKFDAAGARVALSFESARAPRDAWTYEVATGQLTQWTRSEVGPLDAAKFVDAQLIRHPTFDRNLGSQREIPAFLYKPATAGPHPVIIDIHGGPEAQHRPAFDPFTQFLVAELGVAVIAPNVRGSDGYGKTYLQLDNGLKREDAVKDIGALIAWIGQQPDLDRKRIIVMGGSYGGFMSLATLVNFGDRLLGGVDAVGISNFQSFLQNTADYRRDLRRAEYGDERIPQMQAYLRRISPLFNANRITRPLLVVQGMNDPRVPASEAEQMVTTIRNRGGAVWYLMAKDEGHGFRKKQNRDVYLQTVATFIRQLLQTAPAN